MMGDFPYFLFLSVYAFAWIIYQQETCVWNPSVRCGLWYEEDALQPPPWLSRAPGAAFPQHLRQGLGGPRCNATCCAPAVAVQRERAVLLRFSRGASP